MTNDDEKNQFVLDGRNSTDNAARKKRNWRVIAVLSTALTLAVVVAVATPVVLRQSATVTATEVKESKIESGDDKTETTELVVPTPVPSATATQVPQEAPHITAQLLVLTPRGFEPSQIRQPGGRVLFAIVNKSEFPTSVLQLQQVGVSVLRTVELTRNRRRVNVPITLPAGRYKLVDITRPNVFCNIEITE